MAGAVVTVMAWPNAATLAAQPDGSEVKTIVVGTARTGVEGRYVLGDLAVADGYREQDGSINVEIDVTSAAGDVIWNTTGDTQTQGRGPGLHLSATSFDLGKMRARQLASDGSIDTSDVVVAPQTAAGGSTHIGATGIPGCGPWSAGTTRHTTEYYAQANGATYSPAVLTESAGSKHSLDVVVKVNSGSSVSPDPRASRSRRVRQISRRSQNIHDGGRTR